jgi:hypothetical protein
MNYEFIPGPELDPLTNEMWNEGMSDHQKAGGYAGTLKLSKEQIAGLKEDSRVDNLTENFYLWIDDAFGQFDTRQLYGDLGVTMPKDRNLLRVGLHRLVEKGILERGRLTGTFRKVDAETNSIELLDEEPEPIPLKLPGGEEEYVDIHKGNVIANAGSSNQGKTAYDLNVAIKNCDTFEVIYFSSEMGPEELTLRTSKFNVPRKEWKKIKFKKRTQDFQDVIQPDALNIVDYLEVTDGEFYKIGDNIRKIYEKLDSGIALISLQMDRGAKFAWGGQKTLDKARLYITLDNNQLTIVKGKNRASTVNPNGLVRPFKLVNGCDFRWEPWRSGV